MLEYAVAGVVQAIPGKKRITLYLGKCKSGIEGNTLSRQNSNLNQSEIHEPERCLVNAERKCPDCGPAVQRSLWGIEIWSGHHLYITPLYFCVLWLLEIYDQCRGPSIKEKDHLVA